MTIKGIDVSAYQSADFSTSGLGFVMVKATEGTGYVNPLHTAQVAHARAAGLVVGHYHFARPGSVSAQADYFLRHADVQPGDLLAYDWEDTGVPGADKDAWIKQVRAAAPGHRALLYCNLDFWLHRDTTSYCGDGLWIADPDAPAGHPRVEHPWTLHQYSFANGIDRNVANFADLGALGAWAAGTTPTPQEDDPMAGMTPQQIHDAVWKIDDIKAPGDAPDIKTNPTWQPQSVLTDVQARVRAIQAAEAGNAAAIAKLASLIGSGVDTAQVVTAVRDAIAEAVVKVSVDVTGAAPGATA